VESISRRFWNKTILRARARRTRARTRLRQRPQTSQLRRWEVHRDIPAASGWRASTSPSIWPHEASFPRALFTISGGKNSTLEGRATDIHRGAWKMNWRPAHTVPPRRRARASCVTGGSSSTPLRYPCPSPHPHRPRQHTQPFRWSPQPSHRQLHEGPHGACRRPGRQLATVARRNSDRRNSPWWEVARLGQALRTPPRWRRGEGARARTRQSNKQLFNHSGLNLV